MDFIHACPYFCGHFSALVDDVPVLNLTDKALIGSVVFPIGKTAVSDLIYVHAQTTAEMTKVKVMSYSVESSLTGIHQYLLL